jgi:hypothetical protein
MIFGLSIKLIIIYAMNGQFCILCICSFVTMETGYFQRSDLAINSNKIPTIHCTAFDITNSLTKFGVNIYFSL